jgi:hypothetical protein
MKSRVRNLVTLCRTITHCAYWFPDEMGLGSRDMAEVVYLEKG